MKNMKSNSNYFLTSAHQHLSTKSSLVIASIIISYKKKHRHLYLTNSEITTLNQQ